jgi:excisionase family DNA binding protein
MNATTWTIYRTYLDRTGDESVAASLTLADALQSQAERLDAANVHRTDPCSLTVRTAAERLTLSSKKVYQMCQSGQLRCFRAGRAMRIPLEEIERFESDSQPIRTPPCYIGRDHLA